jgi:hypothetical protein
MARDYRSLVELVMPILKSKTKIFSTSRGGYMSGLSKMFISRQEGEQRQE